MDELVSITLSRNDFGQVVDGLRERMNIWGTTAEYLTTGSVRLGEIIEECSDAGEAKAIAEHYRRIIDEIREQMR